MNIKTDYFGDVEYQEGDLITVQEGFFGFPELKRFLPLQLEKNDDSLLLMQSVERREIAFVTVAPTTLMPDYSPAVSTEDLTALEAEDSGILSYYAICVIKSNYLEDTVNLKCPLAIHPKTKMARQVMLENQSYGFRHKLSSFPGILKGLNSESGGSIHADTVSENG